MTEKKDCKKCGMVVYMLPTLTECPYCGSTEFVQHKIRKIRHFSKSISVNRKREKSSLTDEEILGVGLYPKDEGYKMSLISRILGKR